MADTFLIFSKNEAYLRGEHSPPQTSNIQVSYGCLMLYTIPFLVVGIFVIAAILMRSAENANLENNGQFTTGGVVQRDATDNDDSTIYRLYYEYTVSGSPYSDYQQVPVSVYDSYQIDQPIDILYAQSAPDISRIAEVITQETEMFNLMFTLIANAIIIVIIGVIAFNWRRQNRLHKQGKLIRGEIITIDSTTDSDGDFSLELEVRFTTPLLQMGHGKRSYTANIYKGQPLPIPGEQVSILYVDDKLWEIL